MTNDPSSEENQPSLKPESKSTPDHPEAASPQGTKPKSAKGEKRVREVVHRVVDTHAGDALGKTEAKMKKEHLVLVVVISVVILIGAAAAVIFIAMKNEAERALSVQNAPYLYEEEITVTEKLLLERDVKPAREVIKSFLESQNSAHSKSFILQKEETFATFKQYFKPFPRDFELRFDAAFEYESGERIVRYVADFKGGPSREIFAQSRPNSPFLVDWRSLYLSGSIPYDEYVEQLPTTQESVRAYAFVDHYYTTDYPESEYQSVKLTDFQENEPLFAFIKRESERSDRFSNAFLETTLKKGGRSVIRTILGLRLIQKEPLPTVEILEVYSTDWNKYLREGR